MLKKLTGAAALALLACGTCAAEDYSTGSIVISEPRAFETAKTAKVAGGYMTIRNNGAEDDRLLRVESGFPRVMLHTTEETDGVARMTHVDHVDIPAGGTAVMEPGGLHVMFMGLDGDPLAPGENIAATLVFERAGNVEVNFEVIAR